MTFIESECQYSQGTKTPREGTEFCKHCELYVTNKECGASIQEVMEYAALTTSLPCLLPRKGKPLIQRLVEED